MDLELLFLSLWRYVSSSPIDIIALCWFVFCFYGYTHIVDNIVKSSRGLSARMHLYRVQWMTVTLGRENRVVDANIINSLSQSMAFFASTSVLIIAGMLAILSATDQALDIIRELPFATQPTIPIWYTRVGLLIVLFIYAFFKYTWALRQMNYCTILIGAMPILPENPLDHMPSARRAAMVITMAARHMHRGLRTYYFAMACLTWFLNPWFFMITTGAVVWILYRREFKSEIVNVLNMPSEEANRHPK